MPTQKTKLKIIKTKRRRLRLESELRIDSFGKIRDNAFIDVSVLKNLPLDCKSNNVHKIVDYLVAGAENYNERHKKYTFGKGYWYEINIRITSK